MGDSPPPGERLPGRVWGRRDRGWREEMEVVRAAPYLHLLTLGALHSLSPWPPPSPSPFLLLLEGAIKSRVSGQECSRRETLTPKHGSLPYGILALSHWVSPHGAESSPFLLVTQVSWDQREGERVPVRCPQESGVWPVFSESRKLQEFLVKQLVLLWLIQCSPISFVCEPCPPFLFSFKTKEYLTEHAFVSPYIFQSPTGTT